MSDDSSANGHSTDARYVDLEQEVRSLEALVRSQGADNRAMRMSIDMLREQITGKVDALTELMRHVSKQNDEILNNRDGWQVLKRLAALEESMAEKPKRVRAGRK